MLLYHSVDADKPYASATPRGFEEHLEWLKTDCDLVHLDTTLDWAASSEKSRPAVAVTFDDGFADLYDTVFPLLVSHAVPATIFVTTGLIDKTPGVAARFARLHNTTEEDLPPLSWGQIAEMRAAGIRFGAHTHTHPNLASVDPPTVLRELSISRQRLEEELREPIDIFAYPFGKPKHAFTEATMRLVAQSGFAMAAAVNDRGVRPDDNPLRIPRFAVTGDSVEGVRAMVAGGRDLLGRWQDTAPRWLSHAVSPDHSYRGEREIDFS